MKCNIHSTSGYTITDYVRRLREAGYIIEDPDRLPYDEEPYEYVIEISGVEDLARMTKVLDHALVLDGRDEYANRPMIEIYDYWRE